MAVNLGVQTNRRATAAVFVIGGALIGAGIGAGFGGGIGAVVGAIGGAIVGFLAWLSA